MASLEDVIQVVGAIATLDDADQLLLRDVSAQTVNTLTIAALKAALGYQPSDADLTAIAALSTQPVGRSLLAAVDAAAIRAISLSAPLASPTFTGTVVVPAPTAANQPLRTAGVPDAATGFTGLIATSDTGWRNVISWAGGVQNVANQMGVVDTTWYDFNGTANLRMRRVGHLVVLEHQWFGAGNDIIPLTSNGFPSFVPLWPLGFRMLPNFGCVVGFANGFGARIEGAGFGKEAPGIGWLDGSITRPLSHMHWQFFTDDAWPTTLPGIAA